MNPASIVSLLRQSLFNIILLSMPGSVEWFSPFSFLGEVPLGRVFSQHFGFPWQFSFYQMLHSHPVVSTMQ
jgi:hypothetical protein